MDTVQQIDSMLEQRNTTNRKSMLLMPKKRQKQSK